MLVNIINQDLSDLAHSVDVINSTNHRILQERINYPCILCAYTDFLVWKAREHMAFIDDWWLWAQSAMRKIEYD